MMLHDISLSFGDVPLHGNNYCRSSLPCFAMCRHPIQKIHLFSERIDRVIDHLHLTGPLLGLTIRQSPLSGSQKLLCH